MKNNNIGVGAVILAVVVLTLIGCGEAGKVEPPVFTFFPTNHWTVKSVVEGEVVVEARGTNLSEKFRVVRAVPVAPLTNGQPVRVEITVQQKPYYKFEFLSAKAYPAVE